MDMHGSEPPVQSMDMHGSEPPVQSDALLLRKMAESMGRRWSSDEDLASDNIAMLLCCRCVRAICRCGGTAPNRPTRLASSSSLEQVAEIIVEAPMCANEHRLQKSSSSSHVSMAAQTKLKMVTDF